MQKYWFVVGAFVLALVAGLLWSGGAGWFPRETFMQKPVGAPLHGKGIGPYDNVFLQSELDSVVGVVEHGLFIGMATQVLVGTKDGVKTIERE